MSRLSEAQLPLVSVICPIFNSAPYLEETLDSVLAQDFSGFELLLVNDGSTDCSESIARLYSRRHPDKVFYFEHPRHANLGVCATRNLAIRNARGAYLAFLDADDRWRPNKLREQIAVFEAYPEVDLVAGTANYWQSWRGGSDRLVKSGHVQNRVIRPPEASLKVYPLGRSPSPCPSDLIVRTELVRHIGGFEEAFVGPIAVYEDIAFLSKAYLEANVFFDKRVWIDYRLHENSAMHQALACGRYDESRKFFLEWFKRYIRCKRPRAWRVEISRQRAYFHYRPSWLAKSARTAKRGLNKLLRRGRLSPVDSD